MIINVNNDKKSVRDLIVLNGGCYKRVLRSSVLSNGIECSKEPGSLFKPSGYLLL